MLVFGNLLPNVTVVIIALVIRQTGRLHSFPVQLDMSAQKALRNLDPAMLVCAMFIRTAVSGYS